MAAVFNCSPPVSLNVQVSGGSWAARTEQFTCGSERRAGCVSRHLGRACQSGHAPGPRSLQGHHVLTLPSVSCLPSAPQAPPVLASSPSPESCFHIGNFLLSLYKEFPVFLPREEGSLSPVRGYIPL